jgi:hypothetical protein
MVNASFLSGFATGLICGVVAALVCIAVVVLALFNIGGGKHS